MCATSRAIALSLSHRNCESPPRATSDARTFTVPVPSPRVDPVGEGTSPSTELEKRSRMAGPRLRHRPLNLNGVVAGDFGAAAFPRASAPTDTDRVVVERQRLNHWQGRSPTRPIYLAFLFGAFMWPLGSRWAASAAVPVRRCRRTGPRHREIHRRTTAVTSNSRTRLSGPQLTAMLLRACASTHACTDWRSQRRVWMARVTWAPSLGSTRSWSMSAVRTSCPVTRATPRRSAASRCQMSSARCVVAGRSTVRRVRWARGCSLVGGLMSRGGFGCRKPVMRWVGAASPGGVAADVCARNGAPLGWL
jgi:hypothetical protein